MNNNYVEPRTYATLTYPIGATSRTESSEVVTLPSGVASAHVTFQGVAHVVWETDESNWPKFCKPEIRQL
jgi:hypothetical protein